VRPGADIQALIDANPPRTTFCFANGVYRLSGTISTGEKFPTLDLRAGAVIDGQNGGFIGIDGPDAPSNQSGTVILGGVFQHFGNASGPSFATPVIVRRNGVVDGTEFRDNFHTGLGIQGTNARVSHANIHHNGRYGLGATPSCVGCPGPKNVIIEDSVIAFNNTRQLPTNGDAGGTKFVRTDGMIVRRTAVHDNYGSGLWWDIGNRNAQVYENRIYNNRNWGIFWEISYGGTKIHHNTLTNNGIAPGSNNWFNKVQILVSDSDGYSGGIEIFENTVDGTAHPIGLINHRTSLEHGTRGVYVHHNVMTLRDSSTRVGAVAFNGMIELFSPAANNRFEHNTYRVPDDAGRYWAWNGQTLSWSQWLSLEHDADASVEVIT
jgi:hypothetical protein